MTVSVKLRMYDHGTIDRLPSQTKTVDHASAVKWIVDEKGSLVILGSNSKALCIYAAGTWITAEVAA